MGHSCAQHFAGEKATILDIFQLDLDNIRLAVLSACETSLPGMDLIDEMIGLPSGMMQAGVSGVIGSLWAVNDMSTAMLMARFYSLWHEHEEGKNPQEALRQAQIWLRDSTTAQKKELFKHFVDTRAVHMSADTAQAFYQHIGCDDAEERIFESPFYWAAFTYPGVENRLNKSANPCNQCSKRVVGIILFVISP